MAELVLIIHIGEATFSSKILLMTLYIWGEMQTEIDGMTHTFPVEIPCTMNLASEDALGRSLDGSI